MNLIHNLLLKNWKPKLVCLLLASLLWYLIRQSPSGMVPVPERRALEGAVAEVTGLSGFELKRIMRTGTVATIDNRNWELRDQSGPVQRLSQLAKLG